MTYRRLLRPMLGLLAAVAVMTASGCVRVETGPAPSRTATETTLERDALAAALDDIAEALDTQDDSTCASSVESQSIDALLAGVGPRYVAFPDGTPSPSVSAAATDVSALASDALATSVEVAETTADDDLRAWAASSALVHGMAVWLATVDGETADSAASARGLPLGDGESENVVPESTTIDGTALADLALRHDQARYLYQLVASRLSGDAKTDALARAHIHEQRSDELQALSDQPDERSEIYSTEASAVADASSRAATLRDAEASVASAYASYATASGADDVLWLLNGAFDAYAAASLIDGWKVSDLPTLPGLDEPTPAATE